MGKSSTPNPTHSPPAGPLSSDKRSAILAAARSIFLESGYDTASMDAIAATSGVSKITIYRHFQDKETLFAAVVEAECVSKRPVVVPELNSPEAFIAALNSYGGKLVTLLSDPEVHRFNRMLVPHAGRRPRLLQALYDSGPRFALDSVTVFIEAARDKGYLGRCEPAKVADYLLSMWLGMQNRRLMMGVAEPESPAQIRRHVAECTEVITRAFAVRPLVSNS